MPPPPPPPPPPPQPQPLTLIVHGTFAKDETWWRLGDRGAPTFADRLEAALAGRGRRGSVWRPALNSGFDYKRFIWKGGNINHDRVEGGRDLADSLRRLADHNRCTAEKPLVVDLVAHSHGGNVVLEAVRHLDETVAIRRIVLLGTPLVSHGPAFRPVRIVLAFMLVGLAGVMLLAPFVNLLLPEPWAGGVWAIGLFAAAAVGITASGWLFRLAADLADFVIRAVFGTLRVLAGRSAGQAYGPPPEALRARIGGGKITLFTSHQDEADLALHLGAAPRELYLEVVKERLTGIRSALELVLLRPFVDGALLMLLEVALERYVLGFPWAAVMFRNYEMADLEGGRAYPPDVIERIDVTDDLLPALRQKLRAASSPSPLAAASLKEEVGARRHVESLRQSLQTVARDVIAQVRLRHSVYYESEAVIARVADVLAKD